MVPDELRGRVISTYLWAMQGVAPFGSLFMGWMAQTWGAPVAVAFGGSVCLIAVFRSTRSDRRSGGLRYDSVPNPGINTDE